MKPIRTLSFDLVVMDYYHAYATALGTSNFLARHLNEEQSIIHNFKGWNIAVTIYSCIKGQEAIGGHVQREREPASHFLLPA
jgi:hypothetical protein